jgi:hypothetical protein
MQNLFITKKIVLIYALLAAILMYSSNLFSQSSSNSNSSYTVNSSSRNGKSKITVKSKGNEFNIEYEGEFTLSDDDKDIV